MWLSIEALCPYLSWMPLPGLFVSSPSSPNICEMLFEALSRDDLRNSAVECFKVIVTRKVHVRDTVWAIIAFINGVYVRLC